MRKILRCSDVMITMAFSHGKSPDMFPALISGPSKDDVLYCSSPAITIMDNMQCFPSSLHNFPMSNQTDGVGSLNCG